MENRQSQQKKDHGALPIYSASIRLTFFRTRFLKKKKTHTAFEVKTRTFFFLDSLMFHFSFFFFLWLLLFPPDVTINKTAS